MERSIFNAVTAALIVGAAGVAAWMIWPATDAATEVGSSAAETPRSTVTLTASKAAVAAIHTRGVTIETLQAMTTVPGRIAYDENRHVAIRSVTDAVIRSVVVQPGDNVRAGQPLCVISSPAIADAQREIWRLESELQLASRQTQWHTRVVRGLADLVAAINAGASPEDLQKRFGDHTLGDYGGKLIGTYSSLILARRLSASADQIGSGGGISSRVVDQRRSDRQQREAALASQIEQSSFDASTAMRSAETTEQDVRRKLQIAIQRLATIAGGTVSTAQGESRSGHSSDDPDAAIRPEPSSGMVSLVSPIDGVVQSRSCAVGEAVSAGAELFVIADTANLWVQADVRAGDWGAIGLAAGDPISVRTPFTGARVYPARVAFTAGRVESRTGAVVVTGFLANTDGRLHPGQFARVELPVGAPVVAPAVAESAIVEIDGRNVVFVDSGGTYHRREIDILQRVGDRVAIRSGVGEGDQVVVDGAFVLKSELLLEGEE